MGDVVRIFSDDKGNNLKNILDSYGISTAAIEVDSGCYVDTYNIKLSRGSRFSKIENVLVDIGLELESHIPPIGYPVTSDGVYRLEVQRCPIHVMSFGDALGATELTRGMYCPVNIGVTADMSRLVVDLNKLPNLIIGGVPGSGKSMLLHSIILSCLKADADLYLCDPKMVELSLYDECHKTKDISYSAEELRGTISCLIERMHARLASLRRNRVRDIIENNKRHISNGYSNGFFKRNSFRHMNPIVLVIDEWADIFFQDNKVESLLCLLAQKGRAAGISVVIATQRPSAKVLSGLVKASFPGRIAMRSASSIDSRVVLEKSGAERLRDPGVGLYLDPNRQTPVMFRAPLIDNIAEEISRVG
jgi:S-DNA-T family DNA segregation ATPase FtsK/SpoIIIE